MSHIRWRLVMALLSLAATLALTGPAAASSLPGRQIRELWPNGVATVADVIWPNSALVNDIIWPNGGLFNDVFGN
jgi:hypothetical protein